MTSYAHGKEGWVICPKCRDALLGIVGAACRVCGSKLVLTPLLGCIRHDNVIHDEVAISDALDGYTPEELALLKEFGV